MKKTIVITGGAGYVGSHIAYECAQAGYDVTIIDSFIHRQVFLPPWARMVKGDYSDTTLWDTIAQRSPIDAVIHCAALIDVHSSVINPAHFYDNNLVKTIQLLSIMDRHAIHKLVFSSSCAVYGNPHILPLVESHPKNPASPYGKTKLMIEQILEDYAAAYGLHYVSLRYFNAAGAFPEEMLGEFHDPETHIIPLLIQSFFMHTPFKIYGTNYATPDGTCIRDYVHVRDIASAHLAALTHLRATQTSDTFNLGIGKGYSVRELIGAFEKIVGRTLPVLEKPRREGDPGVLVADPTKAFNILGWKPVLSSLEFILKSALRFYQRQVHYQQSHKAS